MSQSKVTGVVDRAFTKTKPTRVGDKIINYVSVGGNEFSTGFQKVFSDGEHCNVVVEYKFGEWQLVPNKIPTNEPDMGSAPPPQAKSNWGGGNKGGGGYAKKSSTFPVEPTDGQMSIIRQNSMNRAVEIMNQWMAFGIVGQLSEEDYIRKLHEVAMTITDFNSGQDIMQLKAAQQANLQVAG